MKYTKKMIAAASVAGVIGAAGIGATAIAATSGNRSDYPPIVQKIASTFGLDPAKVNDVFKQQRQESQQDRQDRLKSRLDQAVKDGELSQEQATKLLAELKTLHGQFKSDRKSDRRQNMQDLRAKLEQWAKDNGINNLDSILPVPPAGMHPMMHHNDGDADDTFAN